MADSSSYDDATLARRYAMAQALMQNSQPVKSWTQGLANMANAALGGYQIHGLDEERRGERAQRAGDNYKMFGVAPPGSPNAGADQFAPVPTAAAPTAAAVPISPAYPAGVPAGVTADTEPGKIYRNDEPSPLDPPSGADRDMAIRTIVAEAGNQPFAGQTGVAAVMRNRAVDGGYGGDSLPGVIQKPSAFEPWNTPAGRDKMAAIPATDPRYATAGKALDAAYFGNDPTEGATHFVAPKAQAALGRPMPSWAQGAGTPIGDHVFYSPDDNSPTAKITQALMRSPGSSGMATDISAQSRAPATAAPAGGAGLFAGMPFEQRVQLAEMSNSRSPEVRAQAHAIAANFISTSLSPKPVQSLGEGYIWQNGKAVRAYTPDEKPPTSVSEHNHYLKTFKPTAQQPEPMGYDTWATAKARAAATNVTTNVGGGTDKQIFEEMVERSKAARATALGLTAIRNSREAIEGGAITGFRADDRLSLQKAAKYFGIPTSEARKIESSEVFKAAIAPQVAAVLKSTVGTSQISDSDRRFAERAAGGSLDLDEASIKRLLDIMERASTSHLQQHQSALDAVYPDPVTHKRERALFGVNVTEGGKPAGATKSGIKWSVE